MKEGSVGLTMTRVAEVKSCWIEIIIIINNEKMTTKVKNETDEEDNIFRFMSLNFRFCYYIQVEVKQTHFCFVFEIWIDEMCATTKFETGEKKIHFVFNLDTRKSKGKSFKNKIKNNSCFLFIFVVVVLVVAFSSSKL